MHTNAEVDRALQVTPMGRYAPLPAPGGACNGYLLRSDATTLLIDGGPGVASRLGRHVDVACLDAIVVSHLHEDHVSDLHCLRFAIAHALETGTRRERLPIYAPGLDIYQRDWLFKGGDRWIDIRPLDPAGMVLGDLAISFYRTQHPIECYAMRITDGRSTLFYSADSSFDPGLAHFAGGADLAIVECSLNEAGRDRRIWGHMTAREVGEFGLIAQPKRLLLTHFWPGFDIPALVAEARAVNPMAEALEEEQTYVVG